MSRRPPLILAAVLVGTALGLAACTSHTPTRTSARGPVAVPAPTATAALVVSSCRALLAAVPEQLDTGVHRRPVTGDATRTAAWGDPAISLRCGVARATSGLGPITIDGLSFYTRDDNGVTTWTTADRAVNVAIDVPKSYDSQAYDVQPLIPAILEALPAPGAAPGA